jgi:hypothetical protein
MTSLAQHIADQEAITAEWEAQNPDARKTCVCTECGEESIYWGGTVYWDAGAQQFAASEDREPIAFCGDCGAEDCEKWIEA